MRRAVLSSKDLGAYAAGHDVARRDAFRRHGAWRAQGGKRAACHATAHGASAPRAGIKFLRSAARTRDYNDWAYHRRSGYDLYPVSIAWEIDEVLERTAAREKAQLSVYSLLQRLHTRDADGKASRQSAIGRVLADIDMMIDAIGKPSGAL